MFIPTLKMNACIANVKNEVHNLLAEHWRGIQSIIMNIFDPVTFLALPAGVQLQAMGVPVPRSGFIATKMSMQSGPIPVQVKNDPMLIPLHNLRPYEILFILQQKETFKMLIA